MRDINKIMPRMPNMRWGALLNRYPTNKKIEYMSKVFPNDGKWHTVFEEKEKVFVDGKRIYKKDLKSWT